jgi:CHAT domain
MRTKNRTIERFIHPTWLVVALLCFQPAALASGSINQEQNEVGELVRGQRVEREIAGGESHTYQISLAAGEFARFRLEQRGIDAALIVDAPDGKQLGVMNLTLAGDEESLSLEAAVTGDYRLTVRVAGLAMLRGTYRLEAAGKAAATAQDKQRIAAESLMIESEKLFPQGGNTAPKIIENMQQTLAIWREQSEPSWEAWCQLSVAKNNGPRTIGDGQPLIVKHEVVSLPSASALAIQRSELAGRQRAPKMLAVIADPVFARADPRFKTTATDAVDKAQTQTTTADDARSIEHLAADSGDKSNVKTVRLVIPRLPFTRQEANQLMALAPKGSSFSALDFQASRATALDPALSQYRYIHIATHGLLDTERPGLSALVFSMVDAEGKPQNGFLRANDIYNLKLPAELVVLSACQTGLGKDIKGEGLVGLTRGFMYAGAARVVVSLWNVNDKATADLMTKFYEKILKQGQTPAAALRAARSRCGSRSSGSRLITGPRSLCRANGDEAH